jgi:hypothetical protein
MFDDFVDGEMMGRYNNARHAQVRQPIEVKQTASPSVGGSYLHDFHSTKHIEREDDLDQIKRSLPVRRT